MSVISSQSAAAKAASSAILKRGDRYLLVRRRHPPAADMYAFPGGKAEPGETPAETALREFEEETGIPVHNPRLFAVYDLKNEGRTGETVSHFYLSVFLVDSDSDSEALAADDAADAVWVTLEEAQFLPMPDSVLECLKKLSGKEQD